MEKNGTFSLFETSVNGNVTFAYIMTFHCTSVLTNLTVFVFNPHANHPNSSLTLSIGLLLMA